MGNAEAGRAPGLGQILNTGSEQQASRKPRFGGRFLGFFRTGARIGAGERSARVSGRPVVGEKDFKEKEEPKESFERLTAEDVQTMIDEGWFEDWDRIKGLKGDVINEKTIPEVWNSDTRKEFRDNVLMPFYFPPSGKEHIVAQDTKGNVIREVDAHRISFAFKWDGKLVAARSYLDRDPWATPADYSNPKFKMAHAQMFIVAPGEGGKGFGTGLAAHMHRELFGQGFTQIITWVNMEGIDYGRQEQFFKGLGYKEDRNRRGLIEVEIAATGERISIRKYWLTQKNYKEHLATDENPWIIWERAKAKLIRRNE